MEEEKKVTEEVKQTKAPKPVKKKEKGVTGKVVCFLVVAAVLALVFRPDLFSFLPERLSKILIGFKEVYLVKNQPLTNSDGGFDFMTVFALVLVIAACSVVSMVVRFLLSLLHFKNAHTETVKSLISSLVKYVIAIYCLIYCLSILGCNVGAVIASLGVLGLIIGFGAQSLIEDIITGFFIVLEGQFGVGDIIAIDDYRGTVTNIGIRTTTLVDTGGNAKIINNSDIRNLVNLSSVSSKAICIAPIAYETDLPKAEALIKDLCKKLPEMYPEIFPVPANYLGVEELNDHSVDLKITADVEEANIFTARRLMNREIFLACNEAGIEIPFMQQVVHIVNN